MATADDETLQARSEADVPELVKGNPVLHKKIWGKMHLHNDNWMGACIGETGSGKSWAALRIAEAVDPNFTVDQVAFSVKEFLELVNDDSLGRGSVIVFEEASVEASAQEWYSQSNRILANVLDTWRNQNRGAIFTLPAFDQLQKTARGRMSGIVEMYDKNESEGYTVAKYKRCQQNAVSGKIYKKAPVIGNTKYRFIKVRPPSPELRAAYEERKEEYTDTLYRDLLEQLEEAEAEEEKQERSPQDIASEILEADSLNRYISDNHGQQYIDRDIIELEFDASHSESKKVKKLLQREVDGDVM